MKGIPDYSESLLEVSRLERSIHLAFLADDKEAALKLSEDLMFAARQLRMWLIADKESAA